MAARYQVIRDDLLGRITSGAWAPGAAIPNEAALAAEFGVTRPTVSRALRGLVDRGLIERKRKAGSRVALHRTPVTSMRVPVVREEIEARGGTYSHLLLGRDIAVPPDSIRAIFGLARGDTALRLRSLHFDNSQPYQLEDRWISLATLPNAAAQDFAATSANEWLVRQVPYTQAEHVLRAEAAGAGEAAALKVACGSPVFVIERTTWSDNAAITWVRLVHPGAGFRLVSRDDG